MSTNTTPAAHNTTFSNTPQDDIVSPVQTSDEESSCPPWTPIHTRAPAISFPPSRSSSRSSSRSQTQRSISKTRIQKRPRSPPPKYHITILPSLASTLNSTSQPPIHPPLNYSAYSNALSHLHTPLVPLISVTTGFPHPQFPKSLLQYHLLTHSQLDSLARWYHQVDPACEETWGYPAWIPPYTGASSQHAWTTTTQTGNEAGGSSDIENVPLSTKRRRWGRFIGLRGCESPEGTDADDQAECLVERMELEWRRAMERMRDEEILREKGWRGRW